MPPRPDHIDDELGVLPVRVLSRPDIERTTGELAEQNVLIAHSKFTRGIAHGRAAVAAAAGLMKH
jgi:hypothetical protein